MTVTLDPSVLFRQSSMAAIVVALDEPRWTILDVNEAYLAVTGTDRENLVGKALFEVFPESEGTSAEGGAHHIAASLSRAIATGQRVVLPLQRYDLRRDHGHGPPVYEEHYWELSSRPLVAGDGSVVAVLHEIANVTDRALGDIERQRLESEVAAQTKELRATAARLEQRTTEAELARRAAEAAEARLATTFAQAPVGIAVLNGPEHRFVLANPFYRKLVNDRDVMGLTIREALPELAGQGIFEILDGVYRSGARFRSSEVAVQMQSHADGTLGERIFDLVYEPLRDAAGSVFGIAVVATDVTAQHAARRAAEDFAGRTDRLQALTAALAGARSIDAVASVLVEETMRANGATTAIFLRQIPGTNDVVLMRRREESTDALDGVHIFPITSPGPAPESLRTGQPIFIGSRDGPDGLLTRYPEVREIWLQMDAHAVASLPLLVGGVAIAVMSFTFAQPRAFDAAERAFLVTVARQGEQALERVMLLDAERRGRERLQTVVESVADGFVAIDADMRFTYVNARAAQMWGLAPSSMIGRTPREIWPHLDLEASHFFRLFRRALTERQMLTMEEYAPTLRHWVETRVYPSESGGLVVFFQDVSERRRAQESAAFLAEASRVLASSADYGTTLANLAKAAVSRLGDWCAVDVLDDPGSTEWPPRLERVAVIHADPSKIALAAEMTRDYPTDWSTSYGLPEVLRTGQPWFIPVVTDEMLDAGARDERHRALLRALHFRSIIVVPLIARDRVLGVLTLCWTESERHYTETDLALAVDLAHRAGVALDNARLLRDAAAANATKTEFLRTISHELRQPLNATMSFLQLWDMELRGPLSTQQRDDLTRIQRNQQHLSALIEDLLSFTRLEAGRLDVERTRVELRDVLDTLDAMIAPQMAAKGVTCTFDECDASLAALGDRDRVVQICLNLVTNAMRATASGGEVHVACAADEDTVSIAVRDTGIGIPSDKLEAIFSPFTQLGRALNQPKEGAGLGLAISRGLAEAMQGTLTATSVVGEGSTFVLTLARATDR